MIDLNNLIDYLPYFYKENDTYKDSSGRGLLERFLDICGKYLEDYPLSNIESFFDTLNDVDSIPELYLPLYWEFLGKLPFANTPLIDTMAARVKLNNFNDIGLTVAETLKTPLGSSPFNSRVDVRSLLKYSIALYRIRGTKKFYEVIFKLYGLDVEVGDYPDGQYLLNVPLYDYETLATPNVYDGKYPYDEVVECTSCIPINFEVHVPGSLTTSWGYQGQEFRESVTALINYFIPFNAQPIIIFRAPDGTELEISQSISLSIVGTNSVLSSGNPVDLKVTISGPSHLYQICPMFYSDSNIVPPKDGWSSDIDIRENPIIKANFTRKLAEGTYKLQPMYYWVRLSEYPDVRSYIVLQQSEVKYWYTLNYVIRGKDNSIVTAPVIDVDNRSYRIEITLIKYQQSNLSDGSNVETQVDPGGLYNVREDLVIVNDQPNPKNLFYSYVVNQGGTYEFYAVEDPSTRIRVSIGQKLVAYGVKITPRRIYADKSDTSRFYLESSLINPVSEFDLIVYNTLDPIGSERSIQGAYGKLSQVTGSSNEVNNYAGDVSKHINELYPDGILSDTQIDTSNLGLPRSFNFPGVMDITFSPKASNAGNISGNISLEFLDTSLNWVFGLYRDGALYNSQEEMDNGVYYIGNPINFALQFNGNLDSISKKISELKTNNQFYIKINDGTNVSLIKHSDTLYVTRDYTVKGDLEAYPVFDGSHRVRVKATEKPTRLKGEPYLVVYESSGEVSMKLESNPPFTPLYEYNPQSETDVCKIRFEGRTSEASYDIVELEQVYDSKGNRYESLKDYDLPQGTLYNFTVSNDGKDYPVDVQVGTWVAPTPDPGTGESEGGAEIDKPGVKDESEITPIV